jgi:serine/threonine protein kinase
MKIPKSLIVKSLLFRNNVYVFFFTVFSRNSAVDFNFPPRRGTGIARHLTHCSSDTIDLITQLCIYDPDNRISAVQALRHPYFDAVR